jgi:hypothetical protein
VDSLEIKFPGCFRFGRGKKKYFPSLPTFFESKKSTIPVHLRFGERKKGFFLPAQIFDRQKRHFSTLPTFQEPPAKFLPPCPHLEKQKRTAQQGYRQPPAFQQSVRRLLVISV